jgi:epoxyqueuosine reductase
LAYPRVVQNKSTHPKIATYALGRDYHKTMRAQLKKLIRKVTEAIGPFEYRIFVDSAPILEKSLAKRAGMGWIGKNTLLIQKEGGSFLVLGGFCCHLPLPPDITTLSPRCESCQQCIRACPTGALSRPYHINAKICIAYLTMEYKGSIPIELRPKVGRYIFGCDECQIKCPWNQSTKHGAVVDDFKPRSYWLAYDLVSLLDWTEETFLKNTEGSAIRRIGYECFLRNVAIALGNSGFSTRGFNALQRRLNDDSPLVSEHVRWAIDQMVAEKGYEVE